MPMRLLPKQEINVRKAQEKRAEMDEGLKLARRVDNLREIAATEEASLASFRSATVKSINDEVRKLDEERIKLISDVTTLREEIKAGKTVLDAREEVLKNQAESLRYLEITLASRVTALKALAAKLKEQSHQSNEYYGRIIAAHRIMNEARNEVSIMYGEAQTHLAQAEAKITTVQQLSKEVEDNLRARDITVASRERDVSIKEARLSQVEKDLHTKEIQLRDREQTLEREFNRLNKTHGS